MRNLSKGLLLKRQSLDQVKENNREFVQHMRAVAIDIALDEGSVTIDDVREYADRIDWQPRHPNAWGAIFINRGWQVIGTSLSKRPANHAHIIRVWEWLGEDE